jgi:hypothetical protein
MAGMYKSLIETIWILNFCITIIGPSPSPFRTIKCGEVLFPASTFLNTYCSDQRIVYSKKFNLLENIPNILYNAAVFCYNFIDPDDIKIGVKESTERLCLTSDCCLALKTLRCWYGDTKR